MKILSAASAFPEYEYTQNELTQALMQYWGEKFFNKERLKSFHKHLKVSKRRFCVDLDQLRNLDNFKSRNDLYIQHALNLGQIAIEKTLHKAGLKVGDVDHIFFTTITGISAPSMDAKLVNSMGFKASVKRTPIFGLGCLGGAALIARACDYLKAYPDQTALILAVELCSLTIQTDDLTIANFVGSGLFADGSAAVVMQGDNANKKGVQVLKTISSFYKDTQQVMGWDVSDTGFKLVLSSNVPKMVKEHAKNDLNNLLDPLGLSTRDIQRYIMHPGGPKVLEAVQKVFGLEYENVKHSWEVLNDHGNISSVSVLTVLEKHLENPPDENTYGVLMAMGPGFCSEWVLLQW